MDALASHSSNHALSTLAVLIGIGATAVMDFWAAMLKHFFGLPTSNWRMVGRWIGHFPRGRFRHSSIADAQPIPGEVLIGWSFHYLTGIAYALLLLLLVGMEWARQPTVIPALSVGLAMLVAPFLVMQPAMGAGVASSRAPNPTAARLRSVANHVVFGLGLYLSARVLASLAQPG